MRCRVSRPYRPRQVPKLRARGPRAGRCVATAPLGKEVVVCSEPALLAGRSRTLSATHVRAFRRPEFDQRKSMTTERKKVEFLTGKSIFWKEVTSPGEASAAESGSVTLPPAHAERGVAAPGKRVGTGAARLPHGRAVGSSVSVPPRASFTSLPSGPNFSRLSLRLRDALTTARRGCHGASDEEPGAYAAERVIHASCPTASRETQLAQRLMIQITRRRAQQQRRPPPPRRR